MLWSLLTLTSGVALTCGDGLEMGDGKLDDVPDVGFLCWQSLLQLHSPNISAAVRLRPESSPLNSDLGNIGAGCCSSIISFVAFISDAVKAAGDTHLFPETSLSRAQALSQLALSGKKQPYAGLGGPAEPTTPEEGDLFPPQNTPNKDSSPGWAFFKSAPPADWFYLFIICAVLFVFDMLVVQRFESGFRTHVMVLLFWVCMAGAFNVLTYFRFGKKEALNWCTGYLLEWILSMDNLFVFHLIFATYKTPENQIHKAVFLGIIGAVVIRMIFFMAVSELLNAFQWVRYPFGALLIWSGIQAARGDDDDEDVKDTYIVRGCKWLFGKRLLDDYDPDGRLVVSGEDGTTQFTLLVLVVACLELSDVIFALDSVSAKIAQIPQQYIAFSSTCLAMYGLRALFFIVKDLVEMFELLQYGLCLILVWIGLELMLSHWLHLSAGTVCILIGSVFAVFTLASIARRRFTTQGAASKDSSTQADDTDSTDHAFEAQTSVNEGNSEIPECEGDTGKPKELEKAASAKASSDTTPGTSCSAPSASIPVQGEGAATCD